MHIIKKVNFKYLSQTLTSDSRDDLDIKEKKVLLPKFPCKKIGLVISKKLETFRQC